jgi:DNA-binding transcriptional LysR family regulator
MNIASINLNLLVALDALLDEGHVGRAARRVGLSQPAMSHALGRLRDLLDDPLLVRTGAGMELTPRAQGLRAPLAAALDQVRGLLAPEAFDPARSTRRFRLMLPDIVLDLLLAPLVERVGREAPGVTLEIAPLHASSALTAELARSIDIVIACMPDALPAFRRERVYRDSDALAVRRGHPLASRLRRRDVFLAARHVAVVGLGAREDMIDEWLRRQGWQRRIAVVTPTYLQALHVAARTDLVAFAPRRLIEAEAKALRLRLIEPPLDPGRDEQFVFYPARAQADAGSIWLRQHILAIGKQL